MNLLVFLAFAAMGPDPSALAVSRAARPQESVSPDRPQPTDGTGVGELDPRTLGPALGVLPRKPPRVVVIDADFSRPEVRPHLLRLDAFVTPGGRVIYLVRQSEVVRLAEQGHSIALCILASIIWHEMAHLEGEEEERARAREEEFWTMLMRDERVDSVTGLRYLRLLRERAHPGPPVTLLAEQLDRALGVGQ